MLSPLACDIALDNITPAPESCPGANDGSITVSASCTTCSGIEYSIDGVNFKAEGSTREGGAFFIIALKFYFSI
ncbi:MAG: hypothetical protein H6557_05890 [Lewinellaceae bacterium]|nr:hypothetical protein [Phaeodactylibacter sp.]MCB9036136.1 hypothetical protein [Lewinellaceae bacterium]